MRPYALTRYGKTCDRCGAAITVTAGERALCGRCASDEQLSREDTRR